MSSSESSGRLGDHDLFIDGQWVESTLGKRLGVVNPATEQEIATLADGTAADVDAAVAAARRSFDDGRGTWAATPQRERARFLERAAAEMMARMETLGALECADVGAPARIAHQFYAGGGAQIAMALATEAARDDTVGLPLTEVPTLSANYILREPLGVCGLILPWNFPIILAAFKVFSALAAGNSVVLKPAPDGSLSSVELTRIFADLELPPGVFNLVTGGDDVGEAIVAHPDVDKISFTGSTQVGRRIMQLSAGNLKRLTLELGGKSPVIVCDDADLDLAVDGILWGVYFHAGQACESGTRVFVSDDLHDELVARLVSRSSTLVQGDPQSWDTDIGPLVSATQRERVEAYIRSGIEQGATLALGGSRPAHLPTGYYVEPTIFVDVDNSMRIAQEEIFGPVLSVLRSDNLDDAVRKANDSIYGLAATVWSTDFVQAVGLAKHLRAGTVWINDHHMINPRAPYGGYKQSGLGRELGQAGLDQFTELKHLHIDLSGRRDRRVWGLVLGH